MNPRKKYLIASGIVVAFVLVVFSFATSARAQRTAQRGKEKVASWSGRVMDLHTYMTGRATTANRKKQTERALRNGVPAVLETANGVFLLGKGHEGTRNVLRSFADERVEVRGKLYEKLRGFRYIDIATVARPKNAGKAPAKPERDREEEDKEDEEDEENEEDEEDEEDAEKDDDDREGPNEEDDEPEDEEP